MTKASVSLVFLIFAPLAVAHHSLGAFFDRNTDVEVEGVVTGIFWRNPHIGLTLEVVNEAGETEAWELEGGAMHTVMRRGMTAESVQIGDHIRAAGAGSRRGELAILVSHILLPRGQEVVVSDREEPPRWTTVTQDAAAVPEDTGAAASGLFKVWGFRELLQIREPLVLTPVAEAAKAAFDPRTDDLQLRCLPPGMPNAVVNPYPMELINEGGQIVQRIEEWDARRVIYMTENRPSQPETAPHLGLSVGRLEGNTLIVETTDIDFPWLDGVGTPMSPDAEILERYTVNEDGTRLDYELMATDPVNLVQPVVWGTSWVYRPGVEVRPFECVLRDSISPVYQQ